MTDSHTQHYRKTIGTQAVIDFNLVHHNGFRIRMIRELLGMSRPKFAEALGIPPTTLKNYELGYRTCDLNIVLTMIWKPAMRELTAAMFVHTQPLKRIDTVKPFEYEFTVSAAGKRYTRAQAADALLQQLLAAAKDSHIEIPTDFEQRWADNGL